MSTIETLAINDATARLSALLSGSANLINKVDARSVELVQKAPHMQVFNNPGASHNVFAMLCDVEPFNNPDLRLAMKYAIDRQAILQTVLHGHGRIGNDRADPRF